MGKSVPGYALQRFPHLNKADNSFATKPDRSICCQQYSNNLPSQRWMASVIPDAKLYAYTRSEQGDHFLMFKNPFKFTEDLRAFLER